VMVICGKLLKQLCHLCDVYYVYELVLNPFNDFHMEMIPSHLYLLQDPESQFIMPEGASQRRGRFELAFSQIGGSVCVGEWSVVHFRTLFY